MPDIMYLLNEEERSLPGFSTVGWRAGRTTGRNTRGDNVVPVTFAVPDFDMPRRDKLFDFVSGIGSSAALETTLGQKSPG